MTILTRGVLRHLVLSALTLSCAQADTGADHYAGADLAAVFARAAEGQPLRYVALGGSITQLGKGWIGPWLHEQFPHSTVTVINAGLSGTGSGLAIFRIERDVIAFQPDLVSIEFCVNDAGASDEEAVRNIESLVVRLKQLPHPPAIIMVEAAAQGGVNLERHRRVAKHYGLLEIDLQKAVSETLKRRGLAWQDLFMDSVHPNQSGHSLYARTLEQELESFLSAPVPDEIELGLPTPLSTKPLILDGHMVRLASLTCQQGWSTEALSAAPGSSYFSGCLAAEEPGTTLTIPFTGTTAGLLYPKDKSYGSFYANIDGDTPSVISCRPPGTHGYAVLGKDLPAGGHYLILSLPPAGTGLNGPVKLGYLLLAGSSGATDQLEAQGPFGPEALKQLRFAPILGEQASLAGPYLIDTPKAHDARAGLDIPFAPEQLPTEATDWEPMPPQAESFDFANGAEVPAPAVVYLRAKIPSPEARKAILALSVDYYAKVWLNGRNVAVYDGPHGAVSRPLMIPLDLSRGSNELLIKVASGSGGHSASLSLSFP